MSKINKKYLKDHYGRLWNSVEAMTYDDIRLAKKTDKFIMNESTARRIAHNAAFIATSTLDAILKR